MVLFFDLIFHAFFSKTAFRLQVVSTLNFFLGKPNIERINATLDKLLNIVESHAWVLNLSLTFCHRWYYKNVTFNPPLQCSNKRSEAIRQTFQNGNSFDFRPQMMQICIFLGKCCLVKLWSNLFWSIKNKSKRIQKFSFENMRDVKSNL